MSYFQTNFASSTTGIMDIDCYDAVTGNPFTPAWYELSVSGQYPSGDNHCHYSKGGASYDGDQYCHAIIAENGTERSILFDDRVLHHLVKPSTSVVSAIEIKHHDFQTNKFRINITKASAAYNIVIRAGA